MLTSQGFPSDSTCILKAEPNFNFETSDYGVIFDFCIDLESLATSFKKCNVIMT